MMKGFQSALKSIIFVLLVLLFVLFGSAILWILITPFKLSQFTIVLSLILKNAGSYSVLLVGIVITVFYQIYMKETEIVKEDKVKIRELGYYTLAFPRKDDTYKEEFNGDKIVVEITNENDYMYEPRNVDEKHWHFFIKFLTSKKESTNMKNIMCFGERYFEENKKDIINNYYAFCEKNTYPSPLYCSTKPTSELKNCDEADRNRYFWLVLDCCGLKYEKNIIKSFWISSVTEDGILVFIKVKVRLEKMENVMAITLLQQTTYYKSQKHIYPLFI